MFLFAFTIVLSAQQFVNSGLAHNFSQVTLLPPRRRRCGPVPL